MGVGRWMQMGLLAAALSVTGCRGDRPSSAQLSGFGLGDAREEDSFQQEEVRRASLVLARAALRGGDTSVPAVLSDLPGRRVFLTAYVRGRPWRVGTGRGENLGASINSAAAELTARTGLDYSGVPDDTLHLRVDVVTRITEDTFGEDAWERPRREDIGLFGFWWDHKPTEDADPVDCFVVPADIIQREMYEAEERAILIDEDGGRRRPPSILSIARGRNPQCAGVQRTDRHMRFWTTAWQDNAARDGSVELYRSGRLQPPATREELLRASVQGSDYLAASIDDDGRFRYLYHAEEDRESRSYNLLRHGGSLYALLQGYERTGYEQYREASERGFEYLIENTAYEELSGHWGTGVRYIVSGRGQRKKVKLGGAGLAVVGMVQYTESTGDQRYMQYMREFAQFILMLIDQENGDPASYYGVQPDGTINAPVTPENSDVELYYDPGDVSIYYPGEALLALARLYYLDPDPRWLKGAQDIANFLINIRDAGKPERNLLNDHWLMIGLSYLHLVAPDPMYVEHVLKISRAVEYRHRGPDERRAREYRDYLGTYYRPPRSTPCSTRLEGLVAGLDLTAIEGLEADTARMLDMSLRTGAFIMSQQYDEDTIFHLPRPDIAIGGVRSGIMGQDIRNDYVQHAVSAWLGTERHLAEAEGVTLPGGPRWSQHLAEGGARFSGLERSEIFPDGHDPTLHHLHAASRAPAPTPEAGTEGQSGE